MILVVVKYNDFSYGKSVKVKDINTSTNLTLLYAKPMHAVSKI